MTAKYIILTSDWQAAGDYATECGLKFNEWQWIRDRFKDPIIYQLINKEDIGRNQCSESAPKVENMCKICGNCKEHGHEHVAEMMDQWSDMAYDKGREYGRM